MSRPGSRSFEILSVARSEKGRYHYSFSTQIVPERRIPVVIPDLKTLVTLRSLLALLLMFWCAGTGCMMVSYARAAANDSGDSALMGHSMGGSTPMDAHACCKATHRSAKAPHHVAEWNRPAKTAELKLLTIPSTPTQSGAMNCCPLTSGSIVVASRSQSNDRSLALEHSDSSSLLTVTSDPLRLEVPLRLPNRSHSYLLDCAFLI